MHPIEQLTAEKNAAYTERNRLVAMIARIYPSSLELNPDIVEAANGWLYICFVDLPTGQASWHIPDGDVPLFEGVQRFAGRIWDQHTTAEKYARVARVRPETHVVGEATDLLRIAVRLHQDEPVGRWSAFVREATAFLHRWGKS